MNALPIQKMSLQEKLHTIDLLWSSIEREDSDKDITPQWHKEELNRRFQAEANGEVFEDWELVKQELQEFSR